MNIFLMAITGDFSVASPIIFELINKLDAKLTTSSVFWFDSHQIKTEGLLESCKMFKQIVFLAKGAEMLNSFDRLFRKRTYFATGRRCLLVK